MKEERFPLGTRLTRNPLRWQRLRVVEGEASEPWRRVQQQGCGGQSGEIPAQRISADQHSPAREACLLTRRGGRGLGAESQASVGLQGEDWGWLREHRLKGASAPRLTGRESGKKFGPAEEAKDFFLPLCFLVQEERGLRAPPKRAPEMGASRGYQRGPQRRAWDAKAATAATKKLVCKHRSLSTPPLLGACASHHCQGPVIQGQLPWENALRASGDAKSCWPLPPQARPTSVPPIPPA